MGPEKWSWWESGSRGGRRRKRRMRTTRRMRRMRTTRRKAVCCLLPAVLSEAAGPPSKADPWAGDTAPCRQSPRHRVCRDRGS